MHTATIGPHRNLRPSIPAFGGDQVQAETVGRVAAIAAVLHAAGLSKRPRKTVSFDDAPALARPKTASLLLNISNMPRLLGILRRPPALVLLAMSGGAEDRG